MRRVIIVLLFSLLSLIAHSSDIFMPLIEEGESFDREDSVYISSLSSAKAIAVSPDNRELIAGLEDGMIKIWDLETGEALRVWQAHSGAIQQLMLTPDGKKIVSLSQREIKVWIRKSGKEFVSYQEKYINGMLSCAENKNIVSVSNDRLRWLNISTKERELDKEKTFSLEKGRYTWVTMFSATSSCDTIVLGENDGSIQLFNSDGTEQRWKAHRDRVRALRLLDNKYIVSASNSVKIWDRATGKKLKEIKKGGSSVSALSVSDDGQLIAIGYYYNGIVTVWDRKKNQKALRLKSSSYPLSIVISPNKKKIILLLDDGTLHIFSMRTGHELMVLNKLVDNILSVGISSDGKRLFSTGKSGHLNIWNSEKRRLEKRLAIATKTDIYYHTAISSDTQMVATASIGGISIYNIKTGKKIKSWKTKSTIDSLLFDSTDKFLIAGVRGANLNSRESGMVIWDIETTQKILHLKGHKYAVTSLAISQSGKIGVSASDEDTIKVWDIKEGRELISLGDKTDVNAVALDSDGKMVISAGFKNIIVWDRETARKVRTFKEVQGSIYSIDLSNDGSILVSGSSEGYVQIWEVETGRELMRFRRDNRPIYSIAITQDGKSILAGGRNGRVSLWNLEDSSLKQEFIVEEEGSWTLLDYQKNKLFRSKSGTGIYHLKGVTLKPFSPPYRVENVKISRDKKKLSVVNQESTDYHLQIKNLSDKRLYWIASYYSDDYCTIKEKRLFNIDVNEEANLSLSIHCSLPPDNPKPMIDKIDLILYTATKEEFHLPLEVSIEYPDIIVEKAEVARDGKILNIKLFNRGNRILRKAEVSLLKPFPSDTQILTNLDINRSKTLSFALPDENISLESGASIALEVHHKEQKYAIPYYRWMIEDMEITMAPFSWFIYLLIQVLLLSSVVSTFYFKRYRNPIVIQLSNNPDKLLRLSSRLLIEAQKRLILINRWRIILESLNITQNRVDKSLAFFTEFTAEEKSQYFCQRVGAKYIKEGAFYRVYLPKSFNLNIDTFLLYISEASFSELKKEALLRDDKVLILSKRVYQKELYQLSLDKTNRIIAPTEEHLMEFLLSYNSEQVLISLLAEALLFKDISPYQINSGINSEANFFGRIEIIRDIVTKESRNYLIVGARQLGKSSIIKALERRYEKSTQLDCYSFTMDDGNILLAICRALDMDEDSRLDEVITRLSNSSRRSLFLIDEADKFIEKEREHNYRVTEAFRKLAQEGKATFILTGFWTLYFYVTSDYHSPLKNFGELIKVEGLEDDACIDLMVEPMNRIGVKYENRAIIEHVISFCGRRPNLIAITCNEVLKHLNGKVITQQSIDEVFENATLEDYLKGWGSMSENRDNNTLDRVIIYLTLEKETFRLHNIDRWLKDRGKKVDIYRIKSSLERLVIGYLLKEEKKNYFYAIPLFKKKLLEDDVALLLESDLERL